MFSPELNLWPGTKALLQAAAGQGHPRSLGAQEEDPVSAAEEEPESPGSEWILAV